MSMTEKQKRPEKTAKRRKAAARLDALVPEAARRSFRNFGFVESAIVTKWPQIVGAMAEHSLPERLTFPPGKRRGGTLYIRVDHAFGLELQHLEPLVIERVNVFFGYAAVKRLAIRQGPLPPAPKAEARITRPLTPAQQRRIEDDLKAVHDPQLRASLARLGAVILAGDGAPKDER